MTQCWNAVGASLVWNVVSWTPSGHRSRSSGGGAVLPRGVHAQLHHRSDTTQQQQHHMWTLFKCIFANFLLIVFCHPGSYKKPYVALIDGITMGGVSAAVSLGSLWETIETIEWYFIFLWVFFYTFSAGVKWPPSQALLGVICRLACRCQ